MVRIFPPANSGHAPPIRDPFGLFRRTGPRHLKKSDSWGPIFFPHVFCPDENGRRSGFAIITCFSNPKKLGETLNHQGFGKNLAIFRVDFIHGNGWCEHGGPDDGWGEKTHLHYSAARSQHKSLLQSINTRWKKKTRDS